MNEFVQLRLGLHNKSPIQVIETLISLFIFVHCKSIYVEYMRNIKFSVIFICCSLLFLNKETKGESIDSLRMSVTKSLPDSIKSDLYLKLCLAYQEENADSAIYFSGLAEASAIRAKDEFRRGKAIQQRGVGFDYANQLDSCLHYLHQAESLFIATKHFDKQGATACDIGMAYYLRGSYELGLRNYLRAYDLMKQYSEKKDICKILNNIGLVYKARRDFKNAVRYYQSSLAIKKEINDEKGIVNTTMNIGSLYQKQDMFDSAYFYANQARMMAEKLNLKQDILSSKSNMGAALASMNRLEEAKEILLAMEKEALENNFRQTMPTISEGLGTIYMQEGNIRLALKYYFDAYDRAKAANSLPSMAVFCKEIANAYAKSGDYKKAYLYLDTTKVMYDSLMNIENSRQINEMSAVYESGEKEKEIQKLNSANVINEASLMARRKERNYFILSTLLFIGLTGIAYRAYVGNRKKKNQLDIQKKQIEKSLEEKEILLKEIHHRVKNNLQIVSSLLSLQSNYIVDPTALDAVRESKNRVQSMAIIHQNLYQDESLVNIDVKEYVEKLVEYLFHSYNIHDNRVKLEMDIHPLQLDVDTLVPLGLVLNELINNCLKYAFPTPVKGRILVRLKLEHDTLKLSVYDNGVGIKSRESHFDQNSFGHKMINAFMKKLKGDIRIYNEDGTKVDIEIRNFKVA